MVAVVEVEAADLALGVADAVSGAKVGEEHIAFGGDLEGGVLPGDGFIFEAQIDAFGGPPDDEARFGDRDVHLGQPRPGHREPRLEAAQLKLRGLKVGGQGTPLTRLDAMLAHLAKLPPFALSWQVSLGDASLARVDSSGPIAKPLFVRGLFLRGVAPRAMLVAMSAGFGAGVVSSGWPAFAEARQATEPGRAYVDASRGFRLALTSAWTLAPVFGDPSSMRFALGEAMPPEITLEFKRQKKPPARLRRDAELQLADARLSVMREDLPAQRRRWTGFVPQAEGGLLIRLEAPKARAGLAKREAERLLRHFRVLDAMAPSQAAKTELESPEAWLLGLWKGDQGGALRFETGGRLMLSGQSGRFRVTKGRLHLTLDRGLRQRFHFRFDGPDRLFLRLRGRGPELGYERDLGEAAVCLGCIGLNRKR